MRNGFQGILIFVVCLMVLGCNEASSARGESYTELETANMLATIHVPSWSNGKIRPAKYRAKNARYNIGICEQLALQLDAKSTSEKTKNFEKLNLIVVAQAPSPG